MKKKELTVKCTFSKKGENLDKLICRSFQLYLRRILASDSGKVVSYQ